MLLDKLITKVNKLIETDCFYEKLEKTNQPIKSPPTTFYLNISLECIYFIFRGVVRWHSFQRASVRPESYIGQSVSSMSTGQLLVLRKLALLKLTSIMEKHCPTHRTGWNWELPKFMRKIKAPDYKGKSRYYYLFLILVIILILAL